MGNVFYRYIGCADAEIVEYSRRGGDSDNDNVKLMDHLEFVELELDESEIEIELV